MGRIKNGLQSQASALVHLDESLVHGIVREQLHVEIDSGRTQLGQVELQPQRLSVRQHLDGLPYRLDRLAVESNAHARFHQLAQLRLMTLGLLAVEQHGRIGDANLVRHVIDVNDQRAVGGLLVQQQDQITVRGRMSAGQHRPQQQRQQPAAQTASPAKGRGDARFRTAMAAND